MDRAVFKSQLDNVFAVQKSYLTSLIFSCLFFKWKKIILDRSVVIRNIDSKQNCVVTITSAEVTGVTVVILNISKVVLKIPQHKLQQYMNCELLDVQAGFRKGKGTREFQKNIHFCFIDYAKAFDCVDENKLWKILKEM